MLKNDLIEKVKNGDDLFSQIGYLPEHIIENFDELPQQLKNEFTENGGSIEYMSTPFTVI